MTLHPRELSTIPPDTAAVAGPLLPAANPYRVLGEQLAEVLTDADFAPLYLPHGRGASSPALLALVTIFQFLEDVPDRPAADPRCPGRSHRLSRPSSPACRCYPPP